VWFLRIVVRKTLVSVLTAMALATSATAQSYDLYYVMPGPAGRLGVDVGIISSDVGSIVDASLVPVMVKVSVSDQIEVGARASLGVLQDGAEDLSRVEVGAKYGLLEATALTATYLVPTGDAHDPGLSVGVMHTLTSGDVMVNNWLQASFLDGYTGGDGVTVSLLIEPTKIFGDQLAVYLDILANTNTGDIGDNLAIDLAPNVDILINDTAVINVGVILGIAGHAKADELGLVVTLLVGF
jgi:hypothetical protein